MGHIRMKKHSKRSYKINGVSCTAEQFRLFCQGYDYTNDNLIKEIKNLKLQRFSSDNLDVVLWRDVVKMCDNLKINARNFRSK